LFDSKSDGLYFLVLSFKYIILKAHIICICEVIELIDIMNNSLLN
jgi:hypothetical protein